MQAHPMYEENRRLRAENERLSRAIRERTRLDLRRYAERKRRREERRAIVRRLKIRMRLMAGAIGCRLKNAACAAREIFGRLPAAVQCAICAWIGAQAVVLLVQAALEMWCAWRI